MDPIDEHIINAAQRLRSHVGMDADTDTAWRELLDDSLAGTSSADNRRRRSVRWVSVGIAAALVAATVVAVVIIGSHGEQVEEQHPATTSAPVNSTATPSSTANPTTVTPTTVSPTAVSPTTVTPTSATPTSVTPTSATPTSATPTSVNLAPDGFSLPSGAAIRSASFPTELRGWAVAETTTADGSTKSGLLHTLNRGATWTSQALDASPLSVTFADDNNGWVVTQLGLRSTHDGGRTWRAANPSGAGNVYAAATDGAVVYVVGFSTKDTAFEVLSSPVDRDDFVASAVRIQPGAGPRADFAIVLRGGHGWVVYNDRTVTGGARLVDGKWQLWTPPCVDTSGAGDAFSVALDAAADGQQLVAVCAPSPFGGTDTIGRVLVSNDAGTTFAATTALPPDFRGAFGDSFGLFVPHDSTLAVLHINPPSRTVEFAVSIDGGATWAQQQIDSPTESFGEPFTVPRGPDVVPIGRGALISADNGTTWRLASPVN